MLAEVVIERDDAVDLGARQVQFLRNDGDRPGRDESQFGLDGVKDFDEGTGSRAMGRHDTEHRIPLSWSKGLHLGHER
jgi:hypothetical protein